MDMLKKIIHIVLIATLLMSPVVSAVSATLMNGDSNPLISSTSHHVHNQSMISDSFMNIQDKAQAQNSDSCCQDCDDECSQVCVPGITQASTLTLSCSFNSVISFIEASYLFIASASPDRPPRLI